MPVIGSTHVKGAPNDKKTDNRAKGFEFQAALEAVKEENSEGVPSDVIGNAWLGDCRGK